MPRSAKVPSSGPSQTSTPPIPCQICPLLPNADNTKRLALKQAVSHGATPVPKSCPIPSWLNFDVKDDRLIDAPCGGVMRHIVKARSAGFCKMSVRDYF